MGIREKLNQHKGMVIGIAITIIVIGAGLSIWQVRSQDRYAPFAGRSFFTVDDGKSWFALKSDQFPPFSHEGKTALGVHVFSCDGGKTQWVGYLERCTPEGKKEMAELRARTRSARDLPTAIPELLSNVEVKKPGGKQWFKESDVPNASVIMQTKCPHNGQHDATVEEVLP